MRELEGGKPQQVIALQPGRQPEQPMRAAFDDAYGTQMLTLALVFEEAVGVGVPEDRLAGQQAEYLRMQLHGFKASTRFDMDGNMTSAAQPLSFADIEILVDYLAGLQ